MSLLSHRDNRECTLRLHSVRSGIKILERVLMFGRACRAFGFLDFFDEVRGMEEHKINS